MAGSFPDGRNALMVVVALLRYVTGNKWGKRGFGKWSGQNIVDDVRRLHTGEAFVPAFEFIGHTGMV